MNYYGNLTLICIDNQLDGENSHISESFFFYLSGTIKYQQ